MLSISLEPDEYVTIGDNIVVKVSRMARGRCFLAIEADRSLPIVRSAVLERNGTPPPPCIVNQPPRKKRKCRPDALFRWNDDREQAVRTMEQIASRLEARGDSEEARAIRNQIDRIIPALWEEEVSPR